jgi:riboflavin biosynthesis pyrimidine reductase
MRQLLPESGRTLDERVDLEAAYATPPDARLRANFVISLDAAVSVGGQSAALGGPADMDVFATLRALTDVVLVGAATVRAESYGPAKIAPPAIERRRARGQSPIPPIAVVTRTGDLDTDSHFFSRQAVRGIVPPPPIILTCEAMPAERRAALAQVADVAVCGDELVDDAVALAALRDRGLAQVLCEGGPTLLAGLVHAALVDELCLTHSPVLAGPGRQYLLGARQGSGAGVVWDDLSRWALTFLAEADGMLFARYRSCSPPPAAVAPTGSEAVS